MDLDSAVTYYLIYRNIGTLAGLAALGGVALLFVAVANGSITPTQTPPIIGDKPQQD